MWPIVPTAAAIGTAFTFARPVSKAAVNYLKSQSWDLNWRKRKSSSNMQTPRKRGRSASRGSSRARSRSRSRGGTFKLRIDHGNTRGRLTNNLHRPKRVSVNVSRGVFEETELALTRAYDDCYYVGASSFNPEYMDILVCAGILRYYYERHHSFKQRFSSLDSVIVGTDQNGSTSVAVQYRNAEAPGAPGAPVDVITYFDWATNATTLREAATALADDMRQKYFGAGTTNGQPYEPLQMWCAVNNNTEHQVNFGMMPLDTMYVNCNCRIVMNVQATTVADEGGTDSRDNITANPLIGKLYYFSDLSPKPRQDPTFTAAGASDDQWGWIHLTSWNDHAPFITPDAANHPTGTWRAPPLESTFRNCTSVGNVRMEPGDIKKAVIRFSFNGKLQKWLKKYDEWGYYAENNAPVANDVTMGTCMILALEKRVRTGPSAVRCNVHFDQFAGASCYLKRTPFNKNYRLLEIAP